MKKSSIASLQERLSDWTDWTMAIYQVGACLGFWPEFGAPSDATGPFDPWHGTKDYVFYDNPVSDAISDLLAGLVEEGCVERRETPDIAFRWNPNYKGVADLPTIL